MGYLKVLMTGLGGAITGGTAIGLMGGQSPSNLQILERKVSELREQLQQSNLDVLSEQKDYELKLEEVTQRIQMSQSQLGDKQTLEEQMKQQEEELLKITQSIEAMQNGSIEDQIKALEVRLKDQ
ncbi:hypothetical protein OVS_03915 [Mycoplasma ovis str. Michigan]|uniref:Uncharacterized protein n=1 Tax=Mycoplasma ovis str. Michigan TaxID=1415773 RepID=A0ABM5P215_9MOLU|nr:hypothetical protein [Mycoplasma ovis]AHC40514.1 hypothetical protein OVS_03915 [Mycoplasma ovis str. Michigan]